MRGYQITSRRRRLTTTVVVVIGVVAATFGAQKALSIKNDNGAQALAPQHATKDFGFRLTPALVEGKKRTQTPVTVTLYEDFLCPSCRVFEKRSGDFLRSAVKQGRIVLEYRPFTFLVGASSNRYTERASNAAACVADSAGVVAYAKFHDRLFAHQPTEGGAGHKDDKLIAWAKKAGAPKAERCIRDEKFADWIVQALAEGKDRGVSTTPTVSVNGSVLQVAGDSGGTAIPGPKVLEQAISRFNK
ncbi:DsbA family protein [Aeromicrobium sp.]|uniref:DsbA family protein n=1 Tax=Aeromicrobium sp. TaxID=1871063 RepID=UPI003C4BBBD5